MGGGEYWLTCQTLDCQHIVPQSRRRVYIAGSLDAGLDLDLRWTQRKPAEGEEPKLADILQPDEEVPASYDLTEGQRQLMLKEHKFKGSAG